MGLLCSPSQKTPFGDFEQPPLTLSNQAQGWPRSPPAYARAIIPRHHPGLKIVPASTMKVVDDVGRSAPTLRARGPGCVSPRAPARRGRCCTAASPHFARVRRVRRRRPSDGRRGRVSQCPSLASSPRRGPAPRSAASRLRPAVLPPAPSTHARPWPPGRGRRRPVPGPGSSPCLGQDGPEPSRAPRPAGRASHRASAPAPSARHSLARRKQSRPFAPPTAAPPSSAGPSPSPRPR